VGVSYISDFFSASACKTIGGGVAETESDSYVRPIGRRPEVIHAFSQFLAIRSHLCGINATRTEFAAIPVAVMSATNVDVVVAEAAARRRDMKNTASG